MPVPSMAFPGRTKPVCLRMPCAATGATQKDTAPALLPGAVALHGLYGAVRRWASVPRDVWGPIWSGQRSAGAENSVDTVVAQWRVRLESRLGLVS